MGKTTEKNQVDSNTSAENPDNSTWNKTIKYVQKELEESIHLAPSNPDDLCQILNLSKRLKSLACTLDKLEAAYRGLLELREIVSENQDKENPDAYSDQS